MLLNNKKIIVLLLLVVLYSGCKKEEENAGPDAAPITRENLIDSLTTVAKKELNTESTFYLQGNFNGDSTIQFILGTEVNNPKEWGIKFHSFEYRNKNLVKDYETHLLKGSFEKSEVRKQRFEESNYDMIYYNSMTYFMGMSGGEIFSYIIDLKNKKVYYGHLFSEDAEQFKLYLSKNYDDKKIQGYMVNNLKKDYPNVKQVSKDVTLE
ncbi:MAG TPA: hypothetical protein VFF33_14310 [Ignavibacteriaceae bacterium]|nr:hypothetical protein [Ignavibacteriaceae bacterium]